MRPRYTMRQARDCLRERLGPVWKAPYAAGKAQMAGRLVDTMGGPHEVAVQFVEGLERNRTLRFESASGRTASPPAHQKVGPTPQSPMRPDVVVPSKAPPPPELGTWFIA